MPWQTGPKCHPSLVLSFRWSNWAHPEFLSLLTETKSAILAICASNLFTDHVPHAFLRSKWTLSLGTGAFCVLYLKTLRSVRDCSEFTLTAWWLLQPKNSFLTSLLLRLATIFSSLSSAVLTFSDGLMSRLLARLSLAWIILLIRFHLKYLYEAPYPNSNVHCLKHLI